MLPRLKNLYYGLEEKISNIGLRVLLKQSFFFQRFAVSVNETRSCAKVTVYSIAYNVIYTHVLQNIVKWFRRVSYSAGDLCLPSLCTPIPYADIDISWCVIQLYWIYRAERWELKWGQESCHSTIKLSIYHKNSKGFPDKTHKPLHITLCVSFVRQQWQWLDI